MSVFVFNGTPGRGMYAYCTEWAWGFRASLVDLCRGHLGGGLLGAWRWRAGEKESERPGAWRATLQIPISYISGLLLAVPGCE
eukprot:1161029-Pelagomonas_calceolata.AAC.1